MGEEEKKTEETKTQEEETKTEETKDEAAAPPPAEILLKVFMHCEGCARKVRRCLKNFPGVEGVTTNCKTHEVVVKGEKADPVKVVERIQTKSRRKVELVSPLPSPPEEEKVAEEEVKPEPEEEEKKEEPEIVTVVLKVHMHCEACAEEIKKRILKMKGVDSVETDLEKSKVIVKGVYDPTMLVKYVHKRFGKQAMIVNEEKVEEKVEEEAKVEEEKVEEEAKVEEEKVEEEVTVEEEKKEEESEEVEEKKEEGENETKPQEIPEGAIVVQETKVEDEMKKNEYYYNPPMDLYAQPPIGYHAYPPIAYPYPACPPYYQTYIPPAPQIFSDENPNACSVM